MRRTVNNAVFFVKTSAMIEGESPVVAMKEAIFIRHSGRT